MAACCMKSLYYFCVPVLHSVAWSCMRWSDRVVHPQKYSLWDYHTESCYYSILVADPPEITQHPKHQSVSPGADVAFFVEATGDDLQFQWQKDGKGINWDESRLQYSQTDKSSTLQIQCVEKSDKGHYGCRVRNAVENSGKTSHTAELTICEFFIAIEVLIFCLEN